MQRVRLSSAEPSHAASLGLQLPQALPPWQHGPHVMQSVPNDTDMYLSEVVRAAAHTVPRQFHDSDERYVKARIFCTNGIVTSRMHSKAIVRALQKSAVITGDRHMVSDWTNESARLGAARSAEAPLPAEQGARRFVCLRNVADPLDALRVGFSRQRLRPEQKMAIVQVLKRVQAGLGKALRAPLFAEPKAGGLQGAPRRAAAPTR